MLKNSKVQQRNCTTQEHKFVTLHSLDQFQALTKKISEKLSQLEGFEYHAKIVQQEQFWYDGVDGSKCEHLHQEQQFSVSCKCKLIKERYLINIVKALSRN